MSEIATETPITTETEIATAEPRGTEDPDVETDAASLAVDDGKGNKLVPLSALVNAKKEARALGKKVKELEPVAARATEIDGRLQTAQPLIDALIANPKLRAEAIRIANGTRTTPATSDQPEDDADATAFAEDAGFYLADGVTVDVARGRRVLERLDARHGRQTDERIRPLAGLTLNEKAATNLREAASQVDGEGVPLATQESIKEVAAQLPSHLLANPQVIDIVLNSAIGLDRRKGRTPKAPDEPLYLETAGGRGRRPDALDADQKKRLDKLGLSEKEYLEASKRMESATTARGTRLE